MKTKKEMNMIYFSRLFETNEIPKKEDYFYKRTNNHITLVKKYIQKLIDLNDPRLDPLGLEDELNNHDSGKFKDPEIKPYIELTWNYHLKDHLGQDIKNSKELQDQIQQATFHHVKTHPHHPEYWNNESTIESINNKDRDKPPEEIVDATQMPLTAIACMVADWCAMSDEKNSDPYDWAKNNINIRWKFTKEQEAFIYEMLNRLYKYQEQYNDWIISSAYYFPRGWGGNIKYGDKTLTIRGYESSKEKLITTLKNMANNYKD
jgi:hypothetical protein